jgi:ribosomal protein S18 acetylase RimI-like enzyme
MDEEEAPQPEFIRFAQNAVSNDKLSLFTGFNEDKPVGAYMLSVSPALYISHFSVLPKFRGIGIGSLFMNEIMNYNNSIRNRYIVLLATKSGRGLYRKFGFRSIADIHIRAFSTPHGANEKEYGTHT